MSWGEVFKINSNMKKPLDEQLKDVNSDMSIPLNELLRVPRLLVYDNSGTFTAPVTGWYLITCIGKGGDGGKAYNAATYTRGYGGGGGGGGTAKSKLKLTKGTTVSITVDSSQSKFGDYLYATAGGNGGNSNASDATDRIGVGGTGGKGYNGNILNANGQDGGIGPDPYGGDVALPWNNSTGGEGFLASTTSGYKAGDGGRGYFPWPLLNGTQGGDGLNGEGSFLTSGGTTGGGGGGKDGTGSLGILGGGGGGDATSASDGSAYGGGGGAAYGGGGGGGEKYDGDSKTSTGNGGTGGAGCVIIEYYE